ncbi:hypothetical protein B296_00053192 [Ensete ventricosum]|uniref:Uncharacterized protein n=1 Tax=Ensete ventricosum TaxID=4639 RepID=A0A426X9P5_ENSVE|nr:hypothetical protein B296_00053192 [Ensete ventricosum]
MATHQADVGHGGTYVPAEPACGPLAYTFRGVTPPTSSSRTAPPCMHSLTYIRGVPTAPCRTCLGILRSIRSFDDSCGSHAWWSHAVKECERERERRRIVGRTKKEMEMKVVRVSGNGQQVTKVPHVRPIVAIRTYCLKESMLDIFPLLIISTGTNDRWGSCTHESFGFYIHLDLISDLDAEAIEAGSRSEQGDADRIGRQALRLLLLLHSDLQTLLVDPLSSCANLEASLFPQPGDPPQSDGVQPPITAVSDRTRAWRDESFNNGGSINMVRFTISALQQMTTRQCCPHVFCQTHTAIDGMMHDSIRSEEQGWFLLGRSGLTSTGSE